MLVTVKEFAVFMAVCALFAAVSYSADYDIGYGLAALEAAVGILLFAAHNMRLFHDNKASKPWLDTQIPNRLNCRGAKSGFWLRCKSMTAR